MSKQETYFELLKNTLRVLDVVIGTSNMPDDIRRVALKHQADIEASFKLELVNQGVQHDAED